MNEKLDGGDIIIKKDLSLKGNLSDIFERMKKNDLEILGKIISGNFNSYKQKGSSSTYKRRKPSDSELKSLNHSKKYLYNFIRMLEDPYPNAFMNVGKHKIIFKSARLMKNKLSVEVDIE